MKVLHNVTMALPLAAAMLFAQSQTTQDPSRSGQSSSSQTDRSAQPGQTDRSGQADRPSGQSGAQSGQSGQSGQRPSSQPGAQSGQQGARPGSTSSQSSTTQSSAQADRTSSGSPMTFTGTIVNAECPQAQALIERTSGSSYADRAGAGAGATAQSSASTSSQSASSQTSWGQSSTTTAKNQKSVYDLQRDVMRRCAASEKAEDLALLTDDGRFLKLDDAGATQVKTEAGKNIKNMKVTINGSLSGDTLTVQSVSKAAAKGGA
jgi:hypothetical protein